MIAWLLVACQGPAGPTPGAVKPAPVAPVAPPAPVASAPLPAPAPPPAPSQRVAKVLEVLETGEYTVMRMDACGAEAWVAGPKTPVKVGQTVAMTMGTVMENFEAKDLGRTFDVILFVDKLEPSDAPLECRPPTIPKEHQDEQGAPPQASLFGVVKETMVSGGYTYARLDVCGKETWIAGPKMPLRVGETVAARDAMPMANFTSPTLGRTFDEIQFVGKMAVSSTPPSCK